MTTRPDLLARVRPPHELVPAIRKQQQQTRIIQSIVIKKK